ncbi:hypothetical protein [Variovorax terrae]|uniref:Uncharacterized protein n=1 Tax=Variovorax terrae TaxID=2923278 RepID=A0A9X2ALU5_9BURK|nr:hypothetical protein [Variovorax terrae]MCJ0763068.1 hypothetical protein [Variovorax terrae]
MMKIFYTLTLLGCFAGSVAAADLQIERVPLGSGLQNAEGFENASPVGDLDVWHVPQYMPGYPTAATIWPRVVEVRCTDEFCEGYYITPEMGRGEYLFFRPVRK